jgi:formylglycine-generating enzyme
MKNCRYIFAGVIFLSLFAFLFSGCKKEEKIQQEQNGKSKTLKDKDSKTFRNSIGMEFVWINPGTLNMGSPTTETGHSDIEKQHKVTLTKGFWMQTTEVTQGQWKAVMGTEPWRGKSYVQLNDKCPAVYVSWNDAKKFCETLSKGDDTYRLPIESEWEYACRAGSKTAYYWGDAGDGKYCWYEANTWGVNEKYAHEVATKEPNKWDIYDMSGNVWEWCEDKYGDYPSGSVIDPNGASTGQRRVLRGGSWRENPTICRSAHHYWNDPGSSSYPIGFRVLRASEQAIVLFYF